MNRCRQRLTSMEAGVLGRQLTCAEQSKVTPLTGMPGRSMRSSRYVMLATAQTGRFSAKAQAGSLWRRLSWCRAASSAACVGSISVFSTSSHDRARTGLTTSLVSTRTCRRRSATVGGGGSQSHPRRGYGSGCSGARPANSGVDRG